jgi:hypothetical protein
MSQLYQKMIFLLQKNLGQILAAKKKSLMPLPAVTILYVFI